MQHGGVIPKLDGASIRKIAVVGDRQHGSYKLPCIGLGATMCTYSNSLQNAQVALYRRVLYRYDKATGEYKPRIVPSEEAVDAAIGRFRRRFTRRSFAPVRCGLGEYHQLYTGHKRKVYEAAERSLVTRSLGFTDWRTLLFVKVENTKLGADPRGIQTRSPRFHASLGRFLKLNEKSFYYGVDSYFGEKTITKGLTAEGIGELMKDKFHAFSDPCAIGLDASRFDRSVSIPLLRFVHDIYRMVLGRDPELEWLLSKQLENVGVAYTDGGNIKYKVEGGIMSGDVDTSLKGCLIMCALVGGWMDVCGVKAKLINNGDDCVAFMERRDAGRFMAGMQEWFLALGFDIVAEDPVYELEKVEFCQARPVLSSNDTYIMCRDPRTATVKDGTCRLDVSQVSSMKAWAGSVADCGMALAGDMPIFCSFYPMLQRYAGGSRMDWMVRHSGYKNGLQWLSEGMSVRSGVTDASRLSFWRAWDILPHVQRLIEEYYMSVNFADRFEGPIHKLTPSVYESPLTLRLLADGS